MKLAFTKMEGIGNDYIYMDGIHQDVPMNKAFIKRISDRHFGIGSDGLIVVLPSTIADFRMRMFNQDGSEAMMCGNGIRCFAKFCFDQGLTNETSLVVETKAGLRHVSLILDQDQVIGASVDMKEPILECSKIPVVFEKEKMIGEMIEVADKKFQATAISMGNPHLVIFEDKIEKLSLETIGPKLEHLAMFPESVNTEFVEVVDRSHIKMRVWERGSKETMACGTGACAAMFASYLNGFVDSKVEVSLLGGTLIIAYQDGHIFMTGPTNTIFHGVIGE